jgi:hypothetical protein
MTNYSQYALKEWSVTIDSLLAGGRFCCSVSGIHEQRTSSALSTRFLSFSTHLHQSLHALHLVSVWF